MGLFKDIVLWKYERASWQWDVLCILIASFIFFSPKAWFERKEKIATQTSRLIVKAEDFSANEAELEKKVKELTGNPDAQVVEFRQKKDAKGNTFYEIDIR